MRQNFNRKSRKPNKSSSPVVRAVREGKDYIDCDKGPAVFLKDGTKKWYRNGVPHRNHDLPAVEEGDGTKKWFKDGKLHRDGNPAVVKKDGTKRWCQNGQSHREDGPALEPDFKVVRGFSSTDGRDRRAI